MSALGLGGWWSWPILFPPAPLGWLSTLAKVDAALLQNRFGDARTLLDEELPESLPVGGWLQWEKRVHAVAVQTLAWEWASSVAGYAQGQYPGNSDLSAYRVWTLLRAGNSAEAAEVARKVLPGTTWAGLGVQAAVEADGLASGDWSALRQTLAQPSPEAFAAYERLVEIDAEPALRKNALVTALALGRLDDARAHLGVLSPAQRDLPPFDRLQGLLAYDQGDWTRAAALLQSLGKQGPDTLMVLADVYLHLGETEQARLIYDQLLADSSDSVSPSLIINRATLALDQNDPIEALGILAKAEGLREGTTLERTRLLVLEARFLVGEVDLVKGALDQMLSSPQAVSLSLEAELLRGRLFPEWTSVPRLWSLLHRHPGFSPLAERLAWLLLVSQDFEGTQRVLDLHDRALKQRGEDSPWWSQMLRAYLFAMEGRLPDASLAFSAVEPAWRDAGFYANWSLVAQIQAQSADPEGRKPFLDESLEHVTKALDMLSPRAASSSLIRRSLWLTRKGELEISLIPLQIPARRGALRSAATEDFRQAVQLDPENLRASFLLRQATIPQEAP